MATQDAISEIDRTVDDEEPREKEVPAPAGRQVLKGRNRQPCGKGPRRKFSFGVRNAKKSRRRECDSSQPHEAARAIVVVSRADREHHRIAIRALLTPI